ncbi:MAG TPA: ornithine carbamoyltransferase [Phycisphaerae bacterium]|jgi:ornithine carbamoyltransferase|nr:ornithine carbamoyltransferase [Phycisphaerae bacterium]HRS28353.1 ornithine carbamoyltransferase [Phycisphaerae bacterium]HRT41449.1 ornithine carbamoyltransferase [Phycisphaerae bacterium]
MAINLRGRSLLSMKDLTGEEINAILARAAELKADRAATFRAAPLAGKTLAMIFQKPSLRTRVSFETGMTLLGGHAIYLAPSDIKLGERETTEDIALVLSRFADIIMARVFGHQIVVDLAKHATVPVINGLSDFEHPCQILADLLTIQERKGRLRGLSATYIGDGNNVAHSLMYGAARVGMNMTVLTPPGFEPLPQVLEESQAIGRETGATIRVTNDLADGAKGADVLYTDVWASMGQEAEAEARRKKFAGFQINSKLMSYAKPDAIILHCLPAHYGEEIDYATSRTPNSAIFDQAENRMHAQNALMVMLA